MHAASDAVEIVSVYCLRTFTDVTGASAADLARWEGGLVECNRRMHAPNMIRSVDGRTMCPGGKGFEGVYGGCIRKNKQKDFM
jgi:hypothetical protein